MNVWLLLLILSICDFIPVFNCVLKKVQCQSFIHIGRMLVLLVPVFLLLFRLIEWNFRYFLLLFFLFVQAMFSMLILMRKSERSDPFKISTLLVRTVLCLFLYFIVLLPAFVFPAYQYPEGSGIYQVGSLDQTYHDQSRVDPYSKAGSQRELTVRYCYPYAATGHFPLLVFSHGGLAFKPATNCCSRN